MNKSVITNCISFMIAIIGYLTGQPIVFTVGLFALSGAITNWLAIHMLFEKIPFLYGSGVIPARFEDFKLGIRNLMMQQFFTKENIDKFLSTSSENANPIEFGPIIDKVDLTPAFDSLIDVIEQSSFAGMLAMVGGKDVLLPLKDDFIAKMKHTMVEISKSEQFNETVRAELEQPDVVDSMRDKVSDIIDKRLNELTPRMVKDIIQEMIKQHLGWLVVWGGIFGGLIGFIAAITNTL